MKATDLSIALERNQVTEGSVLRARDEKLSASPANPAGIDVKIDSIPPKYRKTYISAVKGECAPSRAIKAHCLECVGWDRSEVTNCTASGCTLYKYRPYTKTK